jgi:hypothetical protein
MVIESVPIFQRIPRRMVDGRVGVESLGNRIGQLTVGKPIDVRRRFTQVQFPPKKTGRLTSAATVCRTPSMAPLEVNSAKWQNPLALPNEPKHKLIVSREYPFSSYY